MDEDMMDGNDGQYEDTGSLQPLSDSETTGMFRDLEHELEMLVQKYHVPPNDLDKLFQVVQSMFELMDENRESYLQLEEQKNELEDLWKQEKENLRVAQRRKLELECRLEEEKMRTESEQKDLKMGVVQLETKLKHITEHKNSMERELQRLKEKNDKDEQIRKELLQEYKKQYETAKYKSLKRKASMRASSKHRVAISPPERLFERVQQTPDSFLSSEDSYPQSSNSDMVVAGKTTQDPVTRQSKSLSPGTLSLDQEIQQTTGTAVGTQTDSPYLESTSAGLPLTEDNEELLLEEEEEGDEEISWSGDERALVAPENSSGFSLAEEMMAVDPNLFVPARAEMDMLQKEKEQWEEERERLQGEREGLRKEKEDLEGQNAQYQFEIKQLQQSKQDVVNELIEVRKERDDVLTTYLDQPFDDYCITRKELHELLKKHHITAIELEKAKEEKLRLQLLLEARKGLFERLKIRIRTMFTRSSRQTSTPSSGRHRSSTPSDRTLDNSSSSPPTFSPPPPPSPIMRSLSPVFSHGDFTTTKGWLVTKEGKVSMETLPNWIRQIPLMGMEAERIECAAVGRIYYTYDEGVPPGHMSPPHSRARPHPLGLHQLHAEVWVATNCEGSVVYIEIIDVLAKPSTKRERFVIKNTKHVVCMRSVPGEIEHSTEYTESTVRLVDTSWVEPSYGRRRLSDVSVLLRGRPHTDPISRRRRRKSFSPLETGMFETGLDLSVSPDRSPNGGRANGSVARRLEFSPPIPISSRSRSDSSRLSTRSEPGILTAEALNHIRARNSAIREGTVFHGTILEDPLPIPGSKTLESDHSRVEPGQLSGSRSAQNRQRHGESESRRFGVDFPESGGGRRRRKSSVKEETTIMWVITEDRKLYFHPTTGPIHIPVNKVELPSRALCIEFIRGRVYVGHCESRISVYYMDEVAGSWDIENPEKIMLPSSDPNEYFDVKCMAGVEDRIWVGAGPSIFLLDAETHSREGSIFVDNVDSSRKRPEKIIPVGGLVVVAAKGSALYIFDAKSTRLVRKFDVTPIARLLEPQGKGFVVPTDIKSLVVDENNAYVGTSNGKIVAIPIKNLTECADSECADSESITLPSVEEGSTKGIDGIYQEQSAVSLHTQKDDKVRTLLHIPLPAAKKSSQTENQAMVYSSLPNLSSSMPPRLGAAISLPLYKSFIVSAGKGHIEYSVDPNSVEESSALRERNASFQLLVWGHRNPIP